MNPFFRAMRQNPINNIMNLMNQVQQIKQNPNQLASLLQQRGIITPTQAQDIQKMGNHYEQVGQYLMNTGTMPNEIPQNVIDQAQTMVKKQ